jgi:protein-tyrosine phosphatase
MARVLFICLGNICRSPLAEALFRHKVQHAGLADSLSCDSAGTGGWHAGELPHRGTQQILHQHGIDFSGIRARQLTRADLTEFDYLLTMDNDNLRDVQRLGTPKGTLRPLLAYAPELGYDEVPDPWYDGNFALTYRLVDAACDGLLEALRPTR